MSDPQITVKLLLIDDDPDDVLLVREMLAQADPGTRFQIDDVATKAAALPLLARHEHDIVLLDYQLGGASGLDLLRESAGDAQRPPCIVLTGHGSGVVDQHCLDAGAVDYLTKNALTPQSLARSIRYALERHRLYRLAARREQEYRLLFDLSPVPMWVIEPQSTRVLDVNSAALRQYGYSREEFLALSLLDLRPPSEHARFLEHYAKHGASADQVNAGVWTHRRKDGSELDAEVIRRDLVIDGEVRRLVLALDISERLRSQKQMMLLQRAIEASTDGIVLVDALAAQQPLVYVNPAFERITGYGSAEVLGRNCRFLQGTDREQPPLRELATALAAGQCCEVVVRNYRRDGSPFLNRLNVAPVFDEQQQLSHFVGVLSDVTEQVRLQEERNRLLSNDALTGLPHYSAAIARLQQRLDDACARGDHFAILFVDIDAFHAINDSIDFGAGDAALCAVARRLQASTGMDALVTRYAGDKFVIGLSRSDATHDLAGLAQHICDRMCVPLPVTGVGLLHLTASVGAAEHRVPADTVPELTRQAEFAMHNAKQRGRNTASVFEQSLKAILDDRILLGRRMRAGVERGEFVLHYQPQVNAQDGQVVAVEALARWQHPDLGLLPPQRFIQIAEANGLILPLGLHLLRVACRQLRQWNQQGFPQLTMSVNISPVQLLRPGFVAEVARVVREEEIDPGALELELTESLLMADIDQSLPALHALRKIGVKLALDDFGVGYSSLKYLQRMPLDRLKIDQGFIARIARESTDSTLVRAMIAMAHHLGLRVTAEGVESEAQSNYLKRCHCDQLQGHLFAPALEPAAVVALLQRSHLAIPEPEAAGSERTLLLLDDEDNIRRALVRLLRRDGYRILEAARAEDAFELLANHEVQVVISDQRMPAMSGTEFLSRVKAMYPKTVRMVLSGFTDLSSVTAAINRGEVYKYLTKPWEDEDLRANVLDAFRRAEQQEERHGAGG
ncbi:MAG: EAL domain-containing protein [Xanthomonadales bacterium]|nr:EAL domain-containing protein [Xanthomonadales bacterium]